MKIVKNFITSYEFFISLRYLFGIKKEKLVAVISFISVFGVSIGVAALIVVLAVMSGFDSELKNKIIGSNAHIVIQKDGGIDESDKIIKELKGTEHILGVSGFITGQAIAKDRYSVQGIVVRGIDPVSEPKVTNIKKYMSSNDISLSDNEVVVGNEFSQAFGVKVGDEIEIISPVTGQPFKLKISGVFTSGMYDYDMNLLFVNLKIASQIFATSGKLTGLGVKLDNDFNADKVKDALHKKLGYPYWVRTWMELNKSLFGALKLEKITMFIILTLIVIVASFNIASTLIMTVMEKTKDIGILKSIGVPASSVTKIFMLNGFFIGFIGTAIGAATGLSLSWLLKTYQFVKLPEDIYYIDRLPVKVELADTVFIISSALLISLISTIYPAIKASQLQPVEALRYE